MYHFFNLNLSDRLIYFIIWVFNRIILIIKSRGWQRVARPGSRILSPDRDGPFKSQFHRAEKAVHVYFHVAWLVLLSWFLLIIRKSQHVYQEREISEEKISNRAEPEIF